MSSSPAVRGSLLFARGGIGWWPRKFVWRDCRLACRRGQSDAEHLKMCELCVYGSKHTASKSAPCACFFSRLSVPRYHLTLQTLSLSTVRDKTLAVQFQRSDWYVRHVKDSKVRFSPAKGCGTYTTIHDQFCLMPVPAIVTVSLWGTLPALRRDHCWSDHHRSQAPMLPIFCLRPSHDTDTEP